MEEYKYITSQINLSYTYEVAQERKRLHPKIAKEKEEIIQKHPHFKSEKEALEVALDMVRKKNCRCQVWANTKKDEEFYYIEGGWLVTDDIKVKIAADYIGMTLVYDDGMLQSIVHDNLMVEDIKEMKDLLHYCRYYKGEKDCPYNGDRGTAWWIESMWVDMMLNKSETLNKCLEDYIIHRLCDFEQYDDTPITLKAVLMNRFFKYDERDDVEAFKKFYRNLYK